MNEKKTKKHPPRWALLAVVVAAVAAGCVFSRYGGFGTGPSANVDEFARYAAPVAEVTVPAGARVVALGEATHGSREFQELKLDESYYAIGTDFFEAEVNLPDGEKRMTHTFYSYDPLAKAADACGYGTCWLDFSRVPDDAELARAINEPIMMGSVGEMFSPLMYVLPQTYRIKREPADPYDSMILVTHAHPTQIKAKQ